MADVGAHTTANEIDGRPDYDFDAPATFFEPTADADPNVARFHVSDFGAIADPTLNNRDAIQAAIDAAHAAGGGVVELDAGIYGIAGASGHPGGLEIRDNVFIQGAGIGDTALRVVDGWQGDITGIIRSPNGEANTNYGIADLTLNGNQASTEGQIDAFYTGGTPGEDIADADVWVLRVEAMNASRYGFDPHEQTHRIVIQDSVAHNNGVDGFVADFLIDSIFKNNISYENGRHGFNVVTQSQDILLQDNIASTNGDSGFVVQRGSEDRPSPTGVVIEGGRSIANGNAGVQVRYSDHVIVRDVEILDNGSHGIRLHGASNVTIHSNTLVDNSADGDGQYSGILITEGTDDVTDTIYDASFNLVEFNDIIWSEGRAGDFGVEERDGDVGHNVILDNTVIGTVTSPYVIASASTTLDHPASVGADGIFGGPGNDRINGGDGADVLYGGDGDDVISGDRDNDQVFGEAGDDTLYGRDGEDTVDGGDGNDVISGGKGADGLFGGLGNDVIEGNTGHDTIEGGAGADVLAGNDGDDELRGGEVGDTLLGGKGRDRLFGGDDDDVLAGNSSADELYGDAGNDHLSGDSGNDIMYGGLGDDMIFGGSGRDVIIGGLGDDHLDGGSGSDDFIIDRGDGHDVIDNFVSGADQLVLHGFDFRSFRDFESTFETTENGDLRLNLDADTSVTLLGVAADEISTFDVFL